MSRARCNYPPMNTVPPRLCLRAPVSKWRTVMRLFSWLIASSSISPCQWWAIRPICCRHFNADTINDGKIRGRHFKKAWPRGHYLFSDLWLKTKDFNWFIFYGLSSRDWSAVSTASSSFLFTKKRNRTKVAPCHPWHSYYRTSCT